MENKLCRICGKITDAFLHIFRTEGLTNKIETCLPIIVSPHCLLPDTICTGCYDTVNNFYTFIKNCLQSIIILEAQLDITDSCLKSKRRHEKTTCTDSPPSANPIDQPPVCPHDDDKFNLRETKKKISDFALHLSKIEEELSQNKLNFPSLKLSRRKIVSYDSSSEDERELPTNIKSKLYFDDRENDLINEIAERKSLKRKGEAIMSSTTKIFKIDGSRRKKRPPVKVQYQAKVLEESTWNFNTLEQIYDEMQERQKEIGSDGENNMPVNNTLNVVEKEIINSLPQVCLLCDSQFTGPSLLAAHVYETHGIDMAQVASTEPVPEKRKKIPNLVKITDLKQKRDSQETKTISENGEDPPTLEPTYVCPLCPASLTNKTDLFVHLRQKHPTKSHLLCGLCLHMASSYLNLTDHMEACIKAHPISNPFVCKVCKYSDDNQKTVENHITVHDFLINFCKKEGKIFDPADYIEMNLSCEATKTYTCNECSGATFVFFKEFSTHRRSLHSIFHCDLCNKFYGRNSHLWKHVNRLHKGHPSITCQFCYKTSASKYHLSQHFNKIHTIKSQKLKNGDLVEEEDFMSKKFEAFDFQSVRQSFMRQELNTSSGKKVEEESSLSSSVEVPKEIDTSSNLYTNIITNYTPPANNGEFKCPKCSKGFHKKTLLKKHKKNCRPRLQKDLLTRCKSCSRIFKDRQSLAKHLVNYHSEYACELCEEKVQSKCEIVSHIRFSHPESHLFCPDCKNVLRNQEDLKTHTDDHSNSFVCQFCADLLPSKIKLKMHILSLHRKILSLSCGVCLKLFETQHILRDHVRLVHKDVLQPLTSCTVCGKNYGSKWKTYDHINKSHGRIFRACKACLEVFDTDADLEMHYELVHINIPKEKPIKKEVLIKKEVYESEPERDDKNSSSGEESAAEEPEEPKLSLLEKRLTNPEIIAKPILAPEKTKEKSPKKKSKKLSKSVSAAAVANELEYNPDQNGANSSKRTVYVNSNDPSLCEICFKTWPAKKHLWQHYIRCHKQVAATVCGICLKTNKNYEVLQEHLQTTHPTLLHGKGFGSNFICRICGRYHNASSKLRLHMAIHENFDWKLLEKMKIKTENDDTQDDLEDDINYESLIEQVECSSENENENENDSSSSSESDEEEETENSNEHELEIKQEESDESKSEKTSDEDDDEEDDEDDDESISNNSDNTNEAAVKNMNLYAQHPDVVDSAVKSICYEDDGCDQDYSNSDYEEVQTPNLNPHEIQSAVDSIL